MRAKISQYYRQRPKGYAIVEIILGIVFVVILGISFLPKFGNIALQVRNSANKALSDAFKSSLNGAHAAWVSSGASNAITGSITLVEGRQFHMNLYGWPDNNKSLAPLADDCAVIWNSILSNPPIAGCADCVQDCKKLDNNGCYITSASGSTCKYSLATNPSISITYNMSNGTISATAQ